jgi:hypothetical protein
VATANGFGDRASISPGMGQHQVLFAYELPYDRKLDLDLVSPVPVDAAVMMLPQDGVKLKSDQLTGAGDRTVQGTSYQMYNANSAVQPGQPIKMQLTGRAGASAAATGDPLIPVVISGVIFAAALSGAGYWFISQRRRLQPVGEIAGEEDATMMEEESSDALLEAIVALDDLYQAGNLPEPAYHERRAELKARLANVLSQEKGA